MYTTLMHNLPRLVVGEDYEWGLTPNPALWEGHLPYTFTVVASTDLMKEFSPVEENWIIAQCKCPTSYHWRFQTRAHPGIARVKFWPIMLIAIIYRDTAALLRVPPAQVTWQL